jgi:hypothetical protein
MGSKTSKKTSKSGPGTTHEKRYREEEERRNQEEQEKERARRRNHPSPWERARLKEQARVKWQKERNKQHAAFESARLSREPEQFPDVLNALFQPSSVGRLSREKVVDAHKAAGGGDEGLWYVYRDVGRRLSTLVDMQRADAVHFCAMMFDDLPWWLRKWCLMPMTPISSESFGESFSESSGKSKRVIRRIDVPPHDVGVPTQSFLCDALGRAAANVHAVDAALSGPSYAVLWAKRNTIGFRSLRLELNRILSFLRPSCQHLALVRQECHEWMGSAPTASDHVSPYAYDISVEPEEWYEEESEAELGPGLFPDMEGDTDNDY